MVKKVVIKERQSRSVKPPPVQVWKELKDKYLPGLMWYGLTFIFCIAIPVIVSFFVSNGLILQGVESNVVALLVYGMSMVMYWIASAVGLMAILNWGERMGSGTVETVIWMMAMLITICAYPFGFCISSLYYGKYQIAGCIVMLPTLIVILGLLYKKFRQK
jgi:hypothetical protein